MGENMNLKRLEQIENNLYLILDEVKRMKKDVEMNVVENPLRKKLSKSSINELIMNRKKNLLK